MGGFRCAAVLFCSRRLFYAGGYGIRPYGAEQNIICRGDHILAKQVCHEAKRNIESPVTLSALSFCFAQTNGLPLNPVGTGVLDCPLCCSLYLSASHQQTIIHKLCRGRASGQQVASRPASLSALSFGGAEQKHTRINNKKAALLSEIFDSKAVFR